MSTPVPGEKSVLVGLILTFFFGPVGMLYATVIGALIMLAVSVVIGFLTAGIGLILVWPVQMFWTWTAISGHNRRLRSQFGQAVQRVKQHA